MNLLFMENYHLSKHTASWKESMINRLSNLINRNRSAAKISQVLCSTENPIWEYDLIWKKQTVSFFNSSFQLQWPFQVVLKAAGGQDDQSEPNMDLISGGLLVREVVKQKKRQKLLATFFKFRIIVILCFSSQPDLSFKI